MESLPHYIQIILTPFILEGKMKKILILMLLFIAFNIFSQTLADPEIMKRCKQVKMKLHIINAYYIENDAIYVFDTWAYNDNHEKIRYILKPNQDQNKKISKF